MTNPSNIPETDAVHYGCALYERDIERYADMAEHARKLERERDAARRRCEELKSALRQFVDSGIAFEDPRIEYVEMQIDRDLLTEARALLPE